MTDATPQTLERQLDDLAHALAGSKRAVALTGAGISTESGLPDYRGAHGLWKNRRFAQLASIELFEAEPAEFWEFYRMRLAALRGAQPNDGHRALAKLERVGVLRRIVTQNVDGLHRAAGSDPLEVHGSLDHADCLVCGVRVAIAEAERRATAALDGVPVCDCGANLKPGVVLFGEMLPPAIDEAVALVEECDLLLVCGSSLEVAPVSSFAAQVAFGGGRLAIVNRGATSADALAHIRLDADLGQTLPSIVERALALRDQSP